MKAMRKQLTIVRNLLRIILRPGNRKANLWLWFIMFL